MRSSLSINKRFCIVFVNCKALIKLTCHCKDCDASITIITCHGKVFNIHGLFCKWSLEVSTFRSSGRHCRSISVFYVFFVNRSIIINVQTLTLTAARFLSEGISLSNLLLFQLDLLFGTNYSFLKQ